MSKTSVSKHRCQKNIGLKTSMVKTSNIDSKTSMFSKHRSSMLIPTPPHSRATQEPLEPVSSSLWNLKREDLKMDYNLLDILSEECIDVKATAGHWLESFKVNEAHATTDLVILSYCAAGAIPFTRASVKDLDPKELFVLKSAIHENYKQRISEVAFKNFTDLIDSLLSSHSFEFLTNKKFMNTVRTMLRLFSESDRTGYRVVSVVVGIRVMSLALITEANRQKELTSLKKSLNIIRRKFKESEENRKIFTDLAERKSKLFQRVKKLQKYNNYFKNMFLMFLSSVFEEALRSCEAEVRQHCHMAMRFWCSFIKFDYVRDRFFARLCKLMNDPEDGLREVAVQNFLKCLQNDSTTTLTSTKYILNIVRLLFELALDYKDEVKIQALKCLNIFERYELFSAGRVEKILLLIFHKQREVACEAGYFLHRRILCNTGMSSEKYISELVSFSEKCSENCTEEFLVDSLIDNITFLTDWSAWIKLLIEEDFSSHDEIEVEHLMSLMSCTLKLANTGIVPCGRKAEGNSTSSIRLRNIEESSKIFMENITNLWIKYRSKDRIFHKLLKCFRYLSFGEVDKEFCLELALKFQFALQQSEDLAICNECGIGFAMLCKNSFRNINCRSPEWTLIGEVSDFLEKLCHTFVKKIARKTVEQHKKQSIKIAAYHSLQDITESICWKALFDDICEMISCERERDHKISRLYLIVCFMSLMWIRSLYSTPKYYHVGIPEMLYLEKLQAARDQFFSILQLISRRHNLLSAALKPTARKIILWLNIIKKNNGQ